MNEDTYITLEHEVEFSHNGEFKETKEIAIAPRTINNLGQYGILEETIMQSALLMAEKSQKNTQKDEQQQVIGGDEVVELDGKACIAMLKASGFYVKFQNQFKQFMLSNCKLVLPDGNGEKAVIKQSTFDAISVSDFEAIMGKVGADFLNQAMQENSQK